MVRMTHLPCVSGYPSYPMRPAGLEKPELSLPARFEVKIHDLIMEGIDAVLKKRRYPSVEDLKAGRKR